jgi:Ran GTPase-activating protein (RanGAP) involved in mRNA processing and transport
VISDNCFLNVLNLSNNLLDQRSAVVLSQALKKNKILVELNLSCNKIGDYGIAMIVLPIAKQNLLFMV